MSTLSRRHLVAPTLALALAASLSACSAATEPAAATSTVTMTAASAPGSDSAATSSDQTQPDTTATAAGSPDAASTPTTTHRHTVATSASHRTSTATATPTTDGTQTTSTHTQQAAPTHAGVITLGTAANHPAGCGFGSARPSRIYLGGDPTGDLSGISWDAWGGSSAEGTGTSYYVPAGKATVDAVKATARVRAYDLGSCHGRTAYRKVVWWFPSYGETGPRAGDGPIDTCE